eukprot:CAMPEP_0196602006 /NCGR_PEP_ID=MMETSP1081-20130531/96205_1 /TAXON_ID=36882 /ORGANISM="Pyramimonas amylifera, Strain CCMP720" /LENGTH=122 /DNA_ID=CAMNT_0041927907 /DNA_START=207 /DNA_END=575 /DNA_ORIENTATION=-
MAVVRSVASALSVYLLISISGYHTFGPNVDEDILLQYPSTLAISICRLAISVLVLFSYPLQTAPCRQHLLHLIAYVAGPTGRGARGRGQKWAYVCVTTGILVGSLGVALAVKSLGIILADVF